MDQDAKKLQKIWEIIRAFEQSEDISVLYGKLSNVMRALGLQPKHAISSYAEYPFSKDLEEARKQHNSAK